MKIKASLIKQEAEIEATENEVKSFFNGIVPDFVKETGGILSDTVRFWRWKNQVAIVLKAKKILEEKGLSKQAVPLKVLVPLLEAASLEEEESMQTKWANLLANAVSGSLDITPNYIEILKELSPIEALILDRLYDEALKQPNSQARKKLQFSKEKIAQWLSISSDKADLMVENLFRLNLCRMPGSEGVSFGENLRAAINTTEIFELTTTGYEFVKACKAPENVKT